MSLKAVPYLSGSFNSIVDLLEPSYNVGIIRSVITFNSIVDLLDGDYT